MADSAKTEDLVKRKLAEAENSSKKPKTNDDGEGTHLKWSSLESFKFVKVLRVDPQSKSMCIQATVQREAKGKGDGDKPSEEVQSLERVPADAIVLLEKSAFDTTDVGINSLLSSGTAVSQLFNNDIYGTYESRLPADLNTVKTVIIYPATEKHLEKYQTHESHIIYECPDSYRNITLPYIESASFEMQWIYNILEKKKESEFIVYEDPDPVNGYILIPDLKWDRESLDTMYLSAIVHRHGIRSIRDLTTEHLPLLKNMQLTAINAIEKEYGVDKSKIRAYFHYQPSYYHLHVHFNQIKHTAPGSNVIGAHLLADVIDNIEMYPDYYQRKTLPFMCKENAQLYKRYEAGLKE